MVAKTQFNNVGIHPLFHISSCVIENFQFENKYHFVSHEVKSCTYFRICE